MSRAMKDSEVPWIGDMPNTWRIERGRHIFTLLERPVPEGAKVVTCFRDGEVTLRENRREEGFTISLKEIGYQGIEPGDLVVHGMDGFAGSIGISDSRGKCTPVLNILDSSQNKKFLMYYLRNMAYGEVFVSLATGIRQRSCDTNWKKLREIEYAVPPLEEQQRIADFLDVKTQEVDAAIVKTRESIEEYQKLKQAIITHAVTKGIRPNRAMKDCGVEQIRAMPEQWEVFRLKNAFSAHISGAWGNDKNPHEAGVVCYRIADFAYDKLRFNDETSRTIRYYQSQEIEKLRLTKGDILIEKSGGGEKTPVGRAVLYDKDDGIALYANFMEKLTVADKVNPDWAVYYLSFLYSSKRVIPHIKQTTGLQNLDLRSFLSEEKMLLPPDGEQEEIVHYLDDKCGAIDALIEKKRQIITELESYKKSLIYEYVTGKKEVPA